jgi:hypothetical protein
LIVGCGGCSTTLYESLPVGKTTICDPAWPGRWIPEDPQGGRQIEESSVEINADCTTVTTIDKDGIQRENFKLNLVSTRSGDYLWVSDNDRKPDCLGSDSSHCGYPLMKYALVGDEIRLYNPDHVKVHAAITGRSVPGYSETLGGQTTPSTPGSTPAASASSSATAPAATAPAADHASQDSVRYDNQISGNAEQIAAILEQHPEFFESEPWLILRRDNPRSPTKQP